MPEECRFLKCYLLGTGNSTINSDWGEERRERENEWLWKFPLTDYRPQRACIDGAALTEAHFPRKKQTNNRNNRKRVYALKSAPHRRCPTLCVTPFIPHCHSVHSHIEVVQPGTHSDCQALCCQKYNKIASSGEIMGVCSRSSKSSAHILQSVLYPSASTTCILTDFLKI